MIAKRRAFETDLSVTRDQALATIRSALEDEGLALAPRTGTHDDVSSVITGPGRKTWYVPATRIWTLEEEEQRRALFAQPAR